MFNFFTTPAFLVFLILLGLQTVQATIYVTAPQKGSECRGGEPCTVEWVDNGVVPVLSNIGPCHVGLYNGNGILVQQIEPVDVASTLSLQFTADRKAGPNSGTYYVNFTSVNPVGNPPATYHQYSSFFRLINMSGSFPSPVASDTSPIPIPSSVASPPPNSVSVTITVPVSVEPPSVNPPSASATFSSSSLAESSSPSATPSLTSSALSSPASTETSLSPTFTDSSSSSRSASDLSTSGSSTAIPSSLSTFTASSLPSASLITSRIPVSTSTSFPATPSAPDSTSSAHLSSDTGLIPTALLFSVLFSFILV